MTTTWLRDDPGAKDFGSAYLDSIGELSKELEAQIADHPVFGPLLASMTPEMRETNDRESRARLEKAFAGDWDQYETTLRRDGAMYAALGITFRDWYDITAAWGRGLIRVIVARHASDPPRLQAALATMYTFIERAMAALGTSYIDASEAKLRRKEEELAATLDCIGDGVIATDAGGKVARLNPAACALVGVDARAAVGKPLEEVFRTRLDEGGDGLTAALLLASGRESDTPVLSTRSPIVGADGVASGEVIAFRDITPVRARERELARWEALFQRVPWGIAIMSTSAAEVELANPAFAQMYGLTVDEVRGRPLAAFYAPGELERVVSEHGTYARAAGHASAESMQIRADGTRFPARVESARIPSLHGDEVWVLTVHDLTDRRQMDALRSRSAELESENRKIQEASRLKSEFLANMSHELRTPLNSILGFSELLVEGQVGPLTADQREFIGDIHTSGKHLLRLINDVLDLSKVEAGRMEFHPEQVHLRALVREVTNVLRGIALEKGIEPTVAIDEQLHVVQLDPARLKQVFYNFLSNALKFSPRGGRVDVRLVAETSSFRIEVSDDGPGISLADQKRLFVEFEQLDPTSTKAHAGTGLGLALTRRLVEAQGGTVGVRSAPGEGSTFFAVLPRTSATRASLPQPRRIPGVSSAAPRVLVIEDDPADQERLVRMLVASGYAVDTAATGAQALSATVDRTYDAITLDLLLPDTSGLEVLRRLRAQDATRDVPVIVVSVVSESVTGGFVVHDVLQKPLHATALVDSLARAGVVPPGVGPILVVDDDESSARLMVASLERIGFRAMIAHDGVEGLACAEREHPAAVVLDLVMPKLDGFGFLEQFRANPKWSQVPVLVWSVKDLERADYETLMMRAEAVLPKDGSGARNLVELLRRHVAAPSAAAAP